MKKEFNFVILLTSLSLLVFYCSSEKTVVEPGGGHVQGIISDYETLQPIEFAEVELLNENEIPTGWIDTSDVNGSFILFSGFSAGKMYFRASKDGFLTSTKMVTVIRNDTVYLNIFIQEE